MFLQKGDLRRDGLFVRLEERGVVTARQVDHFGPGCVAGRPDGGAGESALVLVADDDQQGAPDPGGMAAGPVPADPQGDPCGDRLLPVRVASVGIEGLVAVHGVERGERGHRAARSSGRDQERLAPGEAPERVRNTSAEQT